ncbi:hypothetical protein CLU79DRAFT_739002 [Phycomyces nitens]|nr:hypothetical protein CLU79DRAFT_739002 [Phycomyces nitens]
MKNTPKAVLLGWTTLAVCAFGGFTFAKDYTNNKLKDYTENVGSVTSSTGKAPAIQVDQTDANGNRILRRSVDRSL